MTSLYHETKGSGVPVVFVHHGITDSDVWDPQWSSFPAGYELVRVDLVGFGRSPIAGVPLTHARDVAGLLDELGVSGAVVVGASMGGRVALELAVGRPDLVRALVLVGSGLPGVDWSEQMHAYGAAEDEAIAADDLDAATEINMRMWVDGPRRTAAEVEPAFRTAVERMQRRALELQVPQWDELEEELLVPDIGERLGEIAVPTLVLVGEEDVADFKLLASRIAREISGAQLATIPGAAHVPNLEQPTAFDALVLEFLAGTATEGA